jgi:Ca2+/Na+ antiporter
MGYFDALASGNFKTAADGSRLFFPWGILGRGYAVASQEDYQRMRQQIKIYYIVSLVLIIISAGLRAYVAEAVIVVLLLGFYLVWMLSLQRRLQPSNERLSLRESMATQARVHSAAGLWLLEIAALLFVGAGIAMLVFDPSDWLIAVASIAFFGAGAAVFARMLLLRRVAGSPRPDRG